MLPQVLYAPFHDWQLECRTDGEGKVSEQSLEYLQSLDIGYGYTYDDGKTYPFRGKGIGKMPALVKVLQAFPDEKFLIDHKDGSMETAELLGDIIKALPADQRKLLVTVQVGTRNEPRTTSGSVIASKAKQSPAFNCHETGDCFVAPLLAMTPPERLQLLYYWGPDETYEYIYSRIPAATRLLGIRPQVKRCFMPYLLTFGLRGFPEECRGLGIGMPAKYARFIWGWPYRFLKKASEADMRFYLLIDTEEDAQTFGNVPVDGVATDYIEIVGKHFGE